MSLCIYLSYCEWLWEIRSQLNWPWRFFYLPYISVTVVDTDLWLNICTEDAIVYYLSNWSWKKLICHISVTIKETGFWYIILIILMRDDVNVYYLPYFWCLWEIRLICHISVTIRCTDFWIKSYTDVMVYYLSYFRWP